MAEVTWRINRRTWRRRLPRPLPCPARGICLRPRLCPQCKRSEGLGLADLHSCPLRGPSAPPRSRSSGGRGVASPLGLEALQGPPGGTRILFSLVPVLRPLDCFHNFPQKFAPKQSPRKSAQTSFQSIRKKKLCFGFQGLSPLTWDSGPCSLLIRERGRGRHS